MSHQQSKWAVQICECLASTYIKLFWNRYREWTYIRGIGVPWPQYFWKMFSKSSNSKPVIERSSDCVNLSKKSLISYWEGGISLIKRQSITAAQVSTDGTKTFRIRHYLSALNAVFNISLQFFTFLMCLTSAFHHLGNMSEDTPVHSPRTFFDLNDQLLFGFVRHIRNLVCPSPKQYRKCHTMVEERISTSTNGGIFICEKTLKKYNVCFNLCISLFISLITIMSWINIDSCIHFVRPHTYTLFVPVHTFIIS